MAKLLFFIGLVFFVLFVIAGVYYLITNLRFGNKPLVKGHDDNEHISKDNY